MECYHHCNATPRPFESSASFHRRWRKAKEGRYKRVFLGRACLNGEAHLEFFLVVLKGLSLNAPLCSMILLFPIFQTVVGTM